MTSKTPLIENLSPELVLKGGLIVDPINDNLYRADLVIRDSVISYIGLNADYSSDAIIMDISGKYASPGFFDMHVHFREPGNEAAENLISGANSAMAGGYTGVGMMPNTSPAIDNAELLKSLEAKAANHLVEVHAIPSVTQSRYGSELVDMQALVNAGALAFTDDGSGLQKGEVMKQAVLKANSLNRIILVHAEDESFTCGVINESPIADELGLPGISNLSESVMIARDILIAENQKAAVHFQHVSTREGVELIRQAKKRGVRVTAETAPHYFSLTDESTKTLSANYKMKPPLRSKQDVEAIIEGLVDNTIDAIATDHAPHSIEAKALGLLKAPFGVTGLETALSVGLKYLVKPGFLSLPKLVHKLAVAPRKILKLDFDLLKVGKLANLTVFDIDSNWTVNSDLFYSKSVNSAYSNTSLTGKMFLVINKGKAWKNPLGNF